MLACMLPAFSMSYVAFVSIFWFRTEVHYAGKAGPQHRRSLRPGRGDWCRRTTEPPELADEELEEVPEKKLGISFNSCGPQNHPPTTRKLPANASAGARMRLRIPLIDFRAPANASSFGAVVGCALVLIEYGFHGRRRGPAEVGLDQSPVAGVLLQCRRYRAVARTVPEIPDRRYFGFAIAFAISIISSNFAK